MKPNIPVLFAALITAYGACVTSALGQANSAPACRDQAKVSEHSAVADKQKAQTDAVAQFQIDMRNCAIDKACKSAASQRYHDRIREIANQFTLTQAATRKQEINCNQALASLRPIGPARMDPRGGPLTGNATRLDGQVDGGIYPPPQRVPQSGGVSTGATQPWTGGAWLPGFANFSGEAVSVTIRDYIANTNRRDYATSAEAMDAPTDPRKAFVRFNGVVNIPSKMFTIHSVVDRAGNTHSISPVRIPLR